VDCKYTSTYNFFSNHGINSGPVKGGEGITCFGFAASLDASFVKYDFQMCYCRKDEFQNYHLKQLFTNALTAFNAFNKFQPNFAPRVIVFRDGVSDGEIEFMKKNEALYLDYQNLTYIAVNKRTSTRFFTESNGFINNPTPGTLVIYCDDKQSTSVIDPPVMQTDPLGHNQITSMAYQFYLVCHEAGPNSSVNPVRYQVIFDSNRFGGTQEISRRAIYELTYSMSYLYYNWTGTIKSPSPCQYALKMTKFYGQYLPNKHMVECSAKFPHFL